MPTSVDSMKLLETIPINLYVIGGPVLLFIGTISCICNLIIFTRNNLRKNSCSICLIAFNLSSLLLLYFSFLPAILQIGYNIEPGSYNLIYCRIRYYLGFLFACLPSFYLILASIDRTLITSSNIRIRQWNLLPTKRKDVGLPDDIFDDRSKSMDGQYVDGISERRAERKAKRKADRKEVTQVYDWMYTNCRSFRCSCYILTIIWSIGFMLEFLGRLALILAHLTTKEIVIWGHVILGVVVLICGILSLICLIIERRKTLRFIKQWKDGYYYNNIRERRQRRQDYVVWTSH
ncbi:unnamed protein product [Adineta steineri]|uniref:G-protein coupled receptors family 1 profile domain-containing protein n=1 Tax=Adineta steineri TaxID=433720 RepID=A0A813XWY4_9BILA|nr:unnamed protein product [Adineta steineri]CAF0871501.1 unnamed protein product [Adineta steineri]